MNGRVKQLRCWEEVTDPHQDPKLASNVLVLEGRSDGIGCSIVRPKLQNPLS